MQQSHEQAGAASSDSEPCSGLPEETAGAVPEAEAEADLAALVTTLKEPCTSQTKADARTIQMRCMLAIVQATFLIRTPLRMLGPQAAHRGQQPPARAEIA